MKVFASVSLALISFIGMSAAQAADQYPKVYDANYECQNGATKTSVRMTSDGKGKIRSESKAAAYKIVSIMDYPAKTTYAIMDAQKTVMKMPIKDAYVGSVGEVLKTKKAKDLGMKNIAGRNCHGCSYTEKGTTIEMWIDEANQLLVKSNSKTGNIATSMTLVSANNNAPAPSLFAIPKDYKVQAIQ